MSSSALMSLGMKAMSAAYAQMQTTSNNISNANVAGYSRQQVELSTAQGQYTGAGFMGEGVNVTSVTRSYDEFLTQQVRATTSTSSADATRLSQLQQLENVFPTGDAGLGYAANQFVNSWIDVSDNPSDSSARQVVLSQASQLSAQFADSGAQLDALQEGVNQGLSTSVQTVNQLAANIASVNQKIAAVQGGGQPPNDLLDQRDQLIQQLSTFVQVTTVPADDGTVGVFIGGGQRLVLGADSSTLVASSDPDDPSRSTISINDNGSIRPLDSSSLSGGSISGLLQFQNEDLVDARNSLGQMAAAISGAVNQQQSVGVDNGNPPAAGQPIFSVGTPQAIANANNAKDASGNYLSSVSLTTVDASQLQASNYELQADPDNPGLYTLTRTSDGLVRDVASGDVVDGMRIDVGTPAPAATDRFLLKPVGNAADTMQTVLNDPSGLAAASPVTATVPATNTGTASVASLNVVSTSIDPSLTASISFTSAAGDYSYALTDTSGNVVSTGNGTWTPGQPISMNGFALSLNGVPNAGDSFNVGKTLFPATNNGNALAMSNLGTLNLIGNTVDANGHVSGGTDITGAYASAMANVGVRVQSAQNSATSSAAAASNAQDNASSTSGVDIDEEAARLIQYQQSYQAAAKVLQIAQQIFDTLLQTASGS